MFMTRVVTLESGASFTLCCVHTVPPRCSFSTVMALKKHTHTDLFQSTS